MVVAKTSQIFDVQHLQQVLADAHVCLDGGRLNFVPDTSPPTGLFHQNVLKCTKCGRETPVTNFPVIYPVESEQQEPNKRLVIGAATTGIGFKATRGILSTLGLSITSENTFLKHLHTCYDALYDFVVNDFKVITDNIKYNKNQQQEIMDVTISLDGTWKRRGYISNYGVVFIIHADSGMCIDFEVLSLLCEACNVRKKKLSKKKFEKWFSKHKPVCRKNYDGTSKSMEKEGAIRLFQRSLTNGLRYKFMVCDGDTSAYEAVKNHYIERFQEETYVKEGEGKKSINRTIDDDEISDSDEHFSMDQSFNGDQASDGDEGSGSNRSSGDDEGCGADQCSGEGEGSDGDRSSDDDEGSNGDQCSGESSNGDQCSGESSNGDQNPDYEDDEDADVNLLVIKEDCINHVSKRVMKQLLELKREKTRRIPVNETSTKGFASSSNKQQTTQQQLLPDKKKWGGGVGRMTALMMKKLSSSYGIAIRQSSSLSIGKKCD